MELTIGPAIPPGRIASFVIPVPSFGIAPGLEFGLWAIFGSLAIVAVVVATRWSRETGSAFPYFICLGALCGILWDAVIDTFTHVTWHQSNFPPLYHAFGLNIPLWIMAMYVFYIGLTTIMQMKWIEAGFTLSSWMMRFVIYALASVLMEVPLIALDVLHYYGPNQPFRILGYPIWVGFSNASLLFVTPVGLHFLRQSRAGRRYPILFAPAVPMLLLASSGLSALPAGLAMNGSPDVFVTNLGAIASIAIAFILVWSAGTLAVEQRKA